MPSLRTFAVMLGLVAIVLALGVVPEADAAAGLESAGSESLLLAAPRWLPPGFTDTVVWNGLRTPTTLKWAPDGRIFVAQKDGVVKVFESTADVTPTTYTDLSRNVYDFADRGLLGLALDPKFSEGRPYVYVLYTYDKDPNSSQFPRWNDDCPSPPGPDGDGCVVGGRLSRIDPDGTEHVLIEDWCNQYSTHTVGQLNFGPDGALYASSGDGASYIFADYGQGGDPVNPCGDPPAGVGGTQTPPTAEGGALRSQSFRRPAGHAVALNGSIIRVDPDTGAALPDNPAFGDANANRRRIVAYGMRNPFRWTFRPGTSELWFGDVGWNEWEEVNRIPDTATVRNYGWPCYEGNGRMGAYDTLNLSSCETLYSGGGALGPYWTYNHGSLIDGDPGCPAGTSSTTGVAFYTGTQFPSQYRNALFVADYARRCIMVLLPGSNGLPDPATAQVFEASAGGPVDLQQGPDDALYYADIEAGQIHRVAFPTGNHGPAALATATPDHGPTPLTVSFDGSGSSDPDDDTLTYTWDLNGDGVFGDSTAARPAFTYTTPGNYTVRLRVADALGATDTFSLPITAGNAPAVTIDQPDTSLRWAVGDPINYSGSAVDGDGVPIPASGLSWRLDIRHCARTDANNCHTHSGSSVSGVTSGTFVAPNHDYPSKLNLVLTATDAHGLSASKVVTLEPKTVDLTLDSTPAGAELTMGADTGRAPFTERFIENATTDITAPSPQTLGGAPYAFASWSDGGAVTHTITVPTVDTTYTATFSRVTEATLAGADVIGTNVSQATAGRAEVYRITGDVTGSTSVLRLYVDGGSTASALALGLYADAGGNPGTLLGQGETTTVRAGEWNEVELASPIAVTAGTRYWLGLLNPTSSTGTLKWRDRAGRSGDPEQTSAGGALATLPATWATGGRWTDGPVSGYAFGAPSGQPETPELGVSPTSLSLSGVEGGANPAAKTLAVSNTGGGTLTFSVTDDAPWLTVSPTSGTAPSDVTVSASTTGLAAGTYSATVTVSSPATTAPVDVPVTLTVTAPPPPALSVAPSTLAFSAVAGGGDPASKTLAVSNGGSGTLSFAASDDAAWLSVSPTSGTAPASVTAAIDADGLSAGTYTASITITAPGATGSPQVVPVTLTVTSPGGATLAGSDVIGTNVSSAPAGAGEAYRISATTTGTATHLRLYVNATSTASRLVLGLYGDSGGNPTSLLASGALTTVTAGTWNEVVLDTPVSVSAGSAYWFALLNPTSSTGTLRWRDRAGGGGGAEQTSAGRSLTGLPLTWAAGGHYTDGPVSGYVLGGPAPPPSPVLSATPASLAFEATAGAADPASKSISVANTGGGNLSFDAADDAPWMSVSPSSGSAPADVSVAVDTEGLTPGTYTGSVTIDAGTAGSKTIAVTLTVAAPAPPARDVTPATLSFSMQVGAGNPDAKTLSIANTGGGTLGFTASDDAAWLSSTPASGTAPDDVDVAVDASGLVAGTYSAAVTIDGGAAGTRSIPVSLTVTPPPPPALAISPDTLQFTTTQGGAAPPGQAISIANTGSGTVAFTASDDVSWLSESPTSGTANTTVDARVDSTGLAPGTYTATITINGGIAGTKTVGVTLVVSPAVAGQVGAWGFEEATGTTSSDASGNGNLATLSGAVRTTAGKFGRGLTFDGVNDWVTVSDAATLHLTTAITIEGWAYPTSGAASGVWRTLALKEASGGMAWGLYAFGDGGLPSGHAFTSSELWARGTTALGLNRWSHLATTYDGTTIRTYVNGVQVGTKAQSGALRASTGPLRFGGNSIWPEWFEGTLDEIRIYNRALSGTEIQTDMNRPVGSS